MSLRNSATLRPVLAPKFGTGTVVHVAVSLTTKMKMASAVSKTKT